MANSTLQRPYKGVFPVVPTVFDGDGRLDLDGQKRAVDFMIDAGSQGLCILANFSEQFVLTDAERDTVLDAVLEARRGPRSRHRHDDAFCLAYLRRTLAAGRAGGRCHGDGDAALSRRDHPGRRERHLRILPHRFGRDLDSRS